MTPVDKRTELGDIVIFILLKFIIYSCLALCKTLKDYDNNNADDNRSHPDPDN